MAGGTRSNLFGLGCRATCILFWRGTEKILGTGGFADGDRASRGIPDKLFGIAGKFLSAGSDATRQREEVDRHCRFARRAGGSGKDLSASGERLRGLAARIGGLLSRLPGKDRERRASRCANPTGLRLGARERAPGNGEQSVSGHGTRRGIPHFGREPAPGICVVLRARFLLDFVRTQ